MTWPEGPYTRYPRATMWLLRGGDVAMSRHGVVQEVGAFYVSKAPITNAQFEVFDPDHVRPPIGVSDDDPVTNVSWREAAGYCAWYAQWTGKSFRLLSEAEWEYAALGGDEGPSCITEDVEGGESHIWHRGNSGGTLHPVEQRRANGAGLFDVLGSVWEWTSSGETSSNLGVVDSTMRVLRGGSFRQDLHELECGLWRAEDEAWRADDCGFRVARSL